MADGGHGEAEVGQGVDLMAVQVGEEVGAEAGAPFAYVNEGPHGVGSFGSQISHPPKPHHGCLFLPKSKKCRSVSPPGEGEDASITLEDERQSMIKPLNLDKWEVCKNFDDEEGPGVHPQGVRTSDSTHL